MLYLCKLNIREETSALDLNFANFFRSPREETTDMVAGSQQISALVYSTPL